MIRAPSSSSGCDCGCVGLARRNLLGLGLGLGLGAAATLICSPAGAKEDKGYEAMLVKCIDPRFTTDVWNYMTSRGWQNLYSQFNIAGGPIGVVAPAFAKWHETFWDNLAISVKLHNVKRVVGITHRDCGAAAAAYGDRVKTDRTYEIEMHTMALRTFRTEVEKRQPQVEVELGVMALGGAVEPVS
jgi:hypothetical protein